MATKTLPTSSRFCSEPRVALASRKDLARVRRGRPGGHVPRVPHSIRTPDDRVGGVLGSSDGKPWRWPRLSGVWLYLVPMSHAKSPRHQRSGGRPRDPAWEPLGPLHQDRSGVARVSFTVPAGHPVTGPSGSGASLAIHAARCSRAHTPEPRGTTGRSRRSSGSSRAGHPPRAARAAPTAGPGLQLRRSRSSPSRWPEPPGSLRCAGSDPASARSCPQGARPVD